jgi:hypothetical protein
MQFIVITLLFFTSCIRSAPTIDLSASRRYAIEPYADETADFGAIRENSIATPSDVTRNNCNEILEEQCYRKQCMQFKVQFDKIVPLPPSQQEEAFSRLFDLLDSDGDEWLSAAELGSAMRNLQIKPEVYGEFLSEEESKSGVGRDRFMQLLGELKVRVGIAKTQDRPAPVQEPFYQPPSVTMANREMGDNMAAQVPQQQHMSRCCGGLARCGSTICDPIKSGYRCFKDSSDGHAKVGCCCCLLALGFYIVPPVVTGCGLFSLLSLIGHAPTAVGFWCCYCVGE